MRPSVARCMTLERREVVLQSAVELVTRRIVHARHPTNRGAQADCRWLFLFVVGGQGNIAVAVIEIALLLRSFRYPQQQVNECPR